MPFSPSREHKGPEPAFILGFTALEITLTVCGALLLLAFLFLMKGMLNPPIIAGAGIILLWPVRRHRTVQAIMLAGGFLLAIWFLHKLRTILIPFASIYLVAYLFDPLVAFLYHRYNIGRGLSSFVVTLLLISVIGLFILLLAPHLIGEIDALGTRALQSVHVFEEWLITSSFINELTGAGAQKEMLINQMMESIRGFLNSFTNSIPSGLERLLLSVGSIFGAITIIVITPVILFYTMKDYRVIKQGIKYLLPTFGGKQDYLTQISQIVGRYLRGQLTISAISAIIVSIVLMLADIPFALLIGIMSGILNMIPSLGGIITNIAGACIALAFGERGVVDVVIVVTVLLGQGLLEQAILVPKILSQHVGLHPVVILLSLFIFGYFFGFFGLFIAVPLMALIITAYDALRKDTKLDLSPFLSATTSSETLFERFEHSQTDSQNPDESEGVTFPFPEKRKEQDQYNPLHAGLGED